MRRRTLFSAFLLTFSCFATLPAQSPDSSLRAFHTSLAEKTPEQLHALLGTETLPVRKGLVALEVHKRTSNADDASQAVRFFAAALKDSPKEAWVHYGLGATLFREKKTMALVRTLGVADGQAMGVAQRELERALDLAPDFTEAADELGSLALKTKNTRLLDRARGVLSRGASSGEKVARLDMALNDTGAILKRDAISATDHLRKAMVLFGKGDRKAGATEYFAGIANWDEAGANTYITDAEIIATPQEVTALHSGTLGERAKTLQLFWQKRATRDGVTVADRVAEHYRRLAVVRSKYERADRRGAPGAGALLTVKPSGIGKEIDDRGLVYLRYGEPFDRIVVHNTMSQPNESWVYLNPDGTYQNFRFVDMSSSGGFELIADPVLMLLDNNAYLRFKTTGPTAWAQLASDEAVANSSQLFSEVGRYDPRMKLLAARLSSLNSELKAGGAAAFETEQLLNTDNYAWSEQLGQQVRLAVQRDAAPAQFDRPMVVYNDFATFRGNGCTDVVFSVATRAEAYRVLVNVADTVTWETQSVDTLVSKELPANGYLRSTGVLCAKPNSGAYVRLTVSSDSSTGITGGGSVSVPDYSGTALMMSDLLFAAPEDGPFVRGNAHLALIPPRQFNEGAPFRLFYELYNVPRGHKYRTDITFTTTETNPFARLLKGKNKTTVTFDGVADADGVIQELRTLVPEVDPGKVDVAVKVTDLTTQQSAVKNETIWILPAK